MFTIQSIVLQCALTTSLITHFDHIENNFLVSMQNHELRKPRNYGISDGFNLFQIITGVNQDANNITFAYDISVVSYKSFIRFSLNSNIEDPNEIVFIDELEGNDLFRKGNLFLSFSYAGPKLSNLGIHSKEYNWSSFGVDLLFADLDWKYLYNRFSCIFSPTTIQNNMEFYKDINVSNKTRFCLYMKLNNTLSYLNHRSEWKLNSYYRMSFIGLNQKEIGIDLKYNYNIFYQLSLNAQVGFIRYGSSNEWKNLFNCGIGITYIFKDSQ